VIGRGGGGGGGGGGGERQIHTNFSPEHTKIAIKKTKFEIAAILVKRPIN